MNEQTIVPAATSVAGPHTAPAGPWTGAGDPGLHPAGAPPSPAATSPGTGTAPRSRNRVGPILGLVFSVIGLLISLNSLFGLTANVFGPGSVAAEQVASTIQGRIGTGVVVCSDDLPAEVGASITCTVLNASEGGDSVRATVTAVEGDTVSYSMEATG